MTALVAGHPLLALPGVGPLTAARLVAETGDVARFRSPAAFAMLAGVVPIPAGSGEGHRMRLNRGGNRRLDRALYTIALSQAWHHEPARTYIARKRATGKSWAEAHRRESIASAREPRLDDGGSSPFECRRFHMERPVGTDVTDPQRGELGQSESGVEQHERKRPLPLVDEGEEAPQLTDRRRGNGSARDLRSAKPPEPPQPRRAPRPRTSCRRPSDPAAELPAWLLELRASLSR